jgi:hypothetical protein
MKTLVAAAAGTALLGAVIFLPVAGDAQGLSSGIPGYLNPTTGMFTARPALLPATAALKRVGQVNVTITATIGSNIPASVPISCSVNLYADDLGFDNSASASGVFKRTGSNGTCKVSIPYTFEIAVASTQMNVSAFLSANTGTTPNLDYSASFGFSPFPVPSGTKNLAVTLAM